MLRCFFNCFIITKSKPCFINATKLLGSDSKMKSINSIALSCYPFAFKSSAKHSKQSCY